MRRLRTVTKPDGDSVAQWMAEKIETDGCLYQEDAVYTIAETFGDEFTYDNDNDNPAISRKVLATFRKLTEQTVVWERGERMWRKREASDEAGRQAY